MRSIFTYGGVTLVVVAMLFSAVPMTFATHTSTSSLFFNPSVSNVELGDEVTLNVNTHTYISGIDEVLATLTFDATRLQFVRFDSGGTDFPVSVAQSVAGNTITIHRKDEANCPVSGGHVASDSARVASVTFRAIGTGSASVVFDVARSAAYRETGPTGSGCGKFNTLSGALNTAGVAVSDSLKPQLTISAPADGANIQGVTTFSAGVTDNDAIREVRFYLGNIFMGVGTSNTGGPTPTPTPTPTATTTDSAVPNVWMTNPANGSTISGVVTLSARATDDVAVDYVQFRCNGVLAGTATSPFTGTRTDGIFSIGYDTSACSDGSQQIDALAFDTSGKSSSRSAVFVTIRNQSAHQKSGLFASSRSLFMAAVEWVAELTSNVMEVVRGFISPVSFAQTSVNTFTLDYDVSTCGCFGSQTLRVEAEDMSGNVTVQTATVNVVNAPTAPSMPSPSDGATNVAVNATLSWAAAQQASEYEVYLGTTLPATPNVTGLTTPQWTPSTRLTPLTTYQWKVVAKNTSGVETESSVWTFDTAASSDVGAPTLSVLSPSAGDILTGTEVFTVAAADESDFTLAYTVDGDATSITDGCSSEALAPVCGSDGIYYAHQCAAGVAHVSVVASGCDTASDPVYAVSVDTAAFADGPHTFSVQAQDNGGRTSSQSVQFSSANDAPTISISYPPNDGWVRGAFQINVSVSDNKGVSRVEFFVDDVLIGADGTSPYTASYDTRGVADGDHQLTAVVYDTDGLTARATALMHVDNSLPSVQFTAPAAGATVRGDVQLSASATDGQGIARVDFFIVDNGDRTLIESIDQAPYTTTLDSSYYYAYRTYDLIAKAVDNADNAAERTTSVLFDNRPSGVSLYLTPQRRLLAVDDEFTVDLLLNTDGNMVGEVNAELSFDSSKLEVVSVDASQSVFPTSLNNQAVSGNTITIHRSRSTGFNGSTGLVARITFKSLDIILPETLVNFLFVAPGSGPTRAIEACGVNSCTDLLQYVQGGSYGIEPKTGDIGGSAAGPDGVVDIVDLGIMLSRWGWTGLAGSNAADICGGANSTPDGIIDISDLGCLLSNWTRN